ncbi:MAG: branched-chain amino acid ABC transporter permease [Chloroflexia bacterium]
MRLRSGLAIAGFGIVGALLPLFLRSPHWLQVLSLAFYYVVLTSSWNLMMGYTGLFSFAHTALAAIGGYSCALIMLHAGLPHLVALLAAGIVAGLASLLLGVISLRLRGFYLCLVTWAFAEIATGVLRVEYRLTGGTMGLMVPGLFPSAWGKTPYYYLGLLLAIGVLAFMVLLSRSRIGLYLRSIRDDELASEVLGVDTVFWKVFCFTVCGFWAGIGGAYYGYVVGVVDPNVGSLGEMGKVILMVIIGGMGTIPGPVVGTFLVMVLSEFLRGRLVAMSMLIFAVILIVVMRFLPGGMVAAVQPLRARLQRHRPLPSGTTEAAP